MRKGKLSVMMSAGEVLFAEIFFDNGEKINIRKDEYEFVGLYKNRDCWVEGEEIYLDESKVRKLRRRRQRRGSGGGPNQQQESPQQRNEMREKDCIGKHSVLRKARLPKDTRDALAHSDNAFDNFSLKLNKAARFDCRVSIESQSLPSIPEELRSLVRLEDEFGRDVGIGGNPKYLSIPRPLTDHEKNRWLNRNPLLDNNAELAEKKIANNKRKAINDLYKQSQYKERKFRFCETGKNGFLYQPDSFFGRLHFGQIVARHHRGIEALNLSLSSCEGTIDWRLIVGLGNESVYDTSMTLHHVYGIPYIPASAVKGVVRSWMIIEKFGQDEKEAIKDKGFCDVFGCPKKIKNTHSYYEEDRQGKVWFFDALPLSKPRIEVDIMNPHYGEYYNSINLEPPADYLKPNPITFLTVGEKDNDGDPLRFQFLIGIKGKDNEPIGENSKLFKDFNGESIKVRNEKTSGLVDASADTPLLYILEAWLKKSLEERGIGAKTAVGYGFMKDFQAGEDA